MFSESLYLQLLIIVGIPANKSARIANIKESVPFFVVTQTIIAIKDNIPHKISNLVIPQYEFLLNKEAITISKGQNPAIKVDIRSGIATPD